MKKIKYLLLTFLVFLLSMPKAYADCSSIIKDFKKIESEYIVTKKIDKETKTYILEYTNPYPEKYQYSYIGSIFEQDLDKSIDNNIVQIKNIKEGDIKLFIYDATEECTEILKTIEINFTSYNEYADDPLCIGYEEFYLCNPEYEGKVDHETFESRLETYKKDKAKEDNIIVPEKPKEENKIISYIKDNIGTIIVIMTFIVLLTITIIMTLKSIRKSRRLE